MTDAVMIHPEILAKLRAMDSAAHYDVLNILYACYADNPRLRDYLIANTQHKAIVEFSSFVQQLGLDHHLVGTNAFKWILSQRKVSEWPINLDNLKTELPDILTR